MSEVASISEYFNYSEQQGHLWSTSNWYISCLASLEYSQRQWYMKINTWSKQKAENDLFQESNFSELAYVPYISSIKSEDFMFLFFFLESCYFFFQQSCHLIDKNSGDLKFLFAYSRINSAEMVTLCCLSLRFRRTWWIVQFHHKTSKMEYHPHHSVHHWYLPMTQLSNRLWACARQTGDWIHIDPNPI